MATNRTTSTTGIGVRGGVLQLGGLATQPVPFVAPTAFPVTKAVSPIAPVLAPPAVAAALQKGVSPQLNVPINDIARGQIAAAAKKIIPSSVNSVQFRPIADIPPLRVSNSALVNQRHPNEETLSLSRLSFNNGTFEQADPHGVNKLRPEIISLMDFEPLYAGNSLDLNDVGLLMDTQFQARHLREQTFFQLMAGIQQSDQKRELQNIQTTFAANFKKVNTSADFYQSTIATLETVKNGFDVKNIPPNNFDLRTFKTLQDFYQTFMLFPQEAFNQFSGTKVLMQLLFDARSIAEGYSMNLLSLTDPDRQAGGEAVVSPVSIDKTYNNRSGFSFTYDTIRSFNAAMNAAGTDFFNRFNSALPQAPDDRIKLLVNLLSKELRVSRGLGRTGVMADLQQKFAATTTNGSPFDNILGGVGSTIFDPVTGPSSIAALTVVNDTETSSVLPFETKYIDTNNTKKVYIPGSVFFVDSILNVRNLEEFNLVPLRSFVSKYIDTVDSAATLISNIFDYGPRVSPLSPVGLFKLLLQPVLDGLNFLKTNGQREGFDVNAAEGTAVAALRLATNDPRLKALLFQYMLLLILSNPSAGFFAQGILEEMGGDIANLDGVNINLSTQARPNLRNKNEIWPFLNDLGRSIQNRISLLVNQRNLQGNGGTAQARSRSSDPANGLLLIGYDVDIVNGIPQGLYQSKIMSNFVSFLLGLESILGNETNNLLDSAKRTRYNAISVSTLVLVAFEAYIQIISRYAKVDFQTSSYGDNFPDMLVDTNFNAQMYDSMRAIISDPELPLPIIEPEPSTASAGAAKQAATTTERFNINNTSTSLQHTLEQAGKVAQATGTSTSDVQAGIAAYQPIVGGKFATAGSRFTDAASLALRNLTEHVNPHALLDAQAIDQSLNSIAFKLFQEDFSLACVFHILLTVKRRLRSALDLANNYFTRQTLTSLATLNATDISDIAQNLVPAQVRLLLRQRDAYVQQLTPNSQGLQFIPSTPTDVGARNALLSLLTRSAFRETQDAAFRYRLLTVGIPSGFSKNLVERINGNTINSTTFQRNKAYDVITVNVYKRSLEYPQLIFKPRKFIFDLSLFSNGYTNLRVQAKENFDRVLQRVTLLDYQNFTQPTTVTMENVVNNEKYGFIQDPALRRAMVENHILSDLFTAYIQFLTTMRMDESTFVNQESATYRKLSLGKGVDLTPQFSELVRKYLLAKRTTDMQTDPSLSPLPDLPIEEMIQSPSVDQATKDILKLLTFGNIAFKTENAMASLLSPKVFERVFTIPLDVDGFEIDQAMTTATQSGREFLAKNFLQEKLDHHALANGVYKFKPRTHNDAVFEDYFVTIELVQ